MQKLCESGLSERSAAAFPEALLGLLPVFRSPERKRKRSSTFQKKGTWAQPSAGVGRGLARTVTCKAGGGRAGARNRHAHCRHTGRGALRQAHAHPLKLGAPGLILCAWIRVSQGTGTRVLQGNARALGDGAETPDLPQTTVRQSSEVCLSHGRLAR